MTLSPTLLVTGFGPFPGAPENPTAWLMAALQDTGWAPPGVRLAVTTLPVTYDVAARGLVPLIRRMRPAGIVMFGLSAVAHGFTLERTARNGIAAGRPDGAAGLAPSPVIATLGPATRSSTLPLAALVSRLRAAGLPAALSDDAGDYVCNLVFYAALAATAAQPVPTGFVHVPHTRDERRRLATPGTALDAEDLLRGARIILSAVAEDIAAPAAALSAPSAGP